VNKKNRLSAVKNRQEEKSKEGAILKTSLVYDFGEMANI